MHDDLLGKKVDEILTMGEGVKALLFDEDTKVILSNIIPHSRFLENDYFLFDSIMNRRREKIQGITCIAVIRPESIRWLIEEVSSPFYERYIILFTNQIDSLMLEILATSDVYCVISEVHEIYMDFFKQDNFLYTLHRTKVDDYASPSIRKRALDGIFSLIMNLGSIPTIKVQAGDKYLLEDSDMLNTRLTGLNLGQGGTLIMLDRSFDLYTPLLYEWRYQSLLYEHTEYENGIVRIGKKSYSVVGDPFFDASKFKDIYEVSEDIKGLIKKAEFKKKRLHEFIFDDLEENTKLSRQLEAHLAQHGHVMKACLRLKDLSEIEMSILKNNKVSKEEIDEYLARKDISVIERSKLLIIYSLKNRKNPSNEVKRHPDLIDEVEAFTKRYPLLMPIWRHYGYRFDDDVDIKLGYQPAIKRVLRHWWTSRLDGKCFSTARESENPMSYIIVYIRNGITYSEYRALYEYYSTEMEGKSRLYIVGDSMISYKNIMKAI
ncbi:Sec1-like vacuolar protein sorting-associated protein [Encephalitozoon hellem ATCC 50504]|uniref:Syntaxin-binding protein 1 n=1 Tax=Encephalitozoon hellem TaxID=27973 RepID=A0A9Q9C3G5_ENCHE|nr:Sec1-like vacuolar protein sorting-associated protein [Encephalitozoon hellem ATCC 50504]AFM98514.1 Sec1-like vacuolar protein sorting-associated protein [Encephalitozoon hellem ATCC 50504]UTX43441.1 syntaxin-binding protein 1 [Encephalitozoon hellem]|eukprot:XP_003887495.1 Sec1-like vacuolar protein sorting-associated protein [Encephalitozoon hellem ATCC 50504]